MPNKRSWTDHELRTAVVASSSYLKVIQRLRLEGRGGSHYNVKRRIAELGLDTSHFKSADCDFSRSWTDEELVRAVSTASSYVGVVRALGLDPANGVENKVRRRIKMLGISTAHFTRRAGARKSTWSDDQLRDAVLGARSYAHVLRQLGLIPAGGNYRQVQRRIRELGLETAHFTGAAWNGKAPPRQPARSLDELLIKGSTILSHGLKLRLFAAGLKSPCCELCGWAQVRVCDGQIPVELDHVNGDNTDNRLENLRVLCPNCHSFQPTHRALNRRSKRLAAARATF